MDGATAAHRYQVGSLASSAAPGAGPLSVRAWGAFWPFPKEGLQHTGSTPVLGTEDNWVWDQVGWAQG